MKLRNFQISNYKNLKNITIRNASDLHTFIGKNSSGKSSILQAISLLKKAYSDLPNSNEIVSGGIEDYDNKKISITLEFEIEKTERKNYLTHFFQVEFEQVDELIATKDYLSKIKIYVEIQIYGTKHVNPKQKNLILIPQISILIDGQYFPIAQLNEGKNVVRFTFLPGAAIATSSSRNFFSYVKSLGKQEIKFQTEFPGGVFQNALISDINQIIKNIESIRESNKTVPVSTITHTGVSDRGQNLINLMDTMNTNEPERYSEIERFCKNIFQDIENIRPHRRSDNNVRIIIKRKNQSTPVDLAYEGTGIDQLLIIIWRIATSNPGTIWFLDEPELHIHPGAQKLLYDFLREETSRGKRILVATHSMVFMYKSSENETTVALEENGYAKMIGLDQLIQTEKDSYEIEKTSEVRRILYQVLGYDPEMGFEPQKVVMVEGKADQEIFKIFSEIIENPINDKIIKFIVIGDKRKTKQFAPILSYAMHGKKSLIILDNDLDDPKDIKNSILTHQQNYLKQLGMQASILKDDSFCFYDENIYSIEDFLLEPEAIIKAGEIIDPTKIESIKLKIKEELEKPKEKRMKPKKLLENIWEENVVTPYDEVETAKNIASNISFKFLRMHPDIIEIIEKINSD